VKVLPQVHGYKKEYRTVVLDKATAVGQQEFGEQ
jgi:hypothetical protein